MRNPLMNPFSKKLSPRLSFVSAFNERMDQAKNRLVVGIMLFAMAFGVLAIRMIDLGVFQQTGERSVAQAEFTPLLPKRADILDRNGIVLATNLETESLYADPRRVLDPRQAAQRLSAVLPELSEAEVFAKLTSFGRFVWIKRKLTPQQKWQVNALGIPGLEFAKEEERVYPHGSLAAHALGFVDVDGNGLAGVERFFNDRLNDPYSVSEPLQLSLDIRIQHALADELHQTIQRFSAKGAAGVVMDVNTGEVLALASLPDFDPNRTGAYRPEARFNRVTQGVYELGSMFKIFTMAMALDSGVVEMTDSYDATNPIRVSRFTIHDDHPQSRVLTLPEIFLYSSNIGSAKMALDVGGENQRAFLEDLGMMRTPTIELNEVGFPIYPEVWREVSTMTIAYGHGIAVSPLHVATGVSAMVNGGSLVSATLVKQDQNAFSDEESITRRIISSETSAQVRALMRLGVQQGTSRNANVDGYRVGGKTGTAEKSVVGGYQEDSLVSSFVGAFPMDDPKYVVLISVDEPHGIAETYNYATAGWVAAPTASKVISRIGPMLGIEPEDKVDPRVQNLSLLVKDEDD